MPEGKNNNFKNNQTEKRHWIFIDKRKIKEKYIPKHELTVESSTSYQHPLMFFVSVLNYSSLIV